MTVAVCSSCGAAYLASVSTCAECGGLLVQEDAQGEDGEVAYDLADWEPEQRLSLTERLGAEGIDARWEGDEVVVADADADVVEEVIDEIDHPDALAVDEEEASGGADVLSALYVASDVLVGDPENSAAIVELLDAAEVAAAAGVPYGLDGEAWREIRAAADELADVLGQGGSDLDVAAVARRLRDRVRDLV